MPSNPCSKPSYKPISSRGEQLLGALEAIILSEGFSRLNVTGIAARLACSKRTLYELAPSRNELVLRVLAQFFARIRCDGERARDAVSTPERQVYLYLQAGVRAAERMSPMIVADMQAWPPASALWREHIVLRADGLRRLIEQGVASGAFLDTQPAFVAEMVFASINRLREPDFLAATGLTISAAFDELYRLLLRALTTPVAAGQRNLRLASGSGKLAQHG